MIHIRDATPADAEAVGRIQLASWRTMFPDAGLEATAYLAQFSDQERADDWRSVISNEPDTFVLVAEVADGEVVGFAYGGPPEPESVIPYQCELTSVHLLPTHRGQGIGRALIAAFAERSLALGLTTLYLWTLAGNRARGLYERLGGQVVGQQRVVVGKNDVGIEIEEVAYGWQDLTPLLR